MADVIRPYGDGGDISLDEVIEESKDTIAETVENLVAKENKTLEDEMRLIKEGFHKQEDGSWTKEAIIATKPLTDEDNIKIEEKDDLKEQLKEEVEKHNETNSEEPIEIKELNSVPDSERMDWSQPNSELAKELQEKLEGKDTFSSEEVFKKVIYGTENPKTLKQKIEEVIFEPDEPDKSIKPEQSAVEKPIEHAIPAFASNAYRNSEQLEQEIPVNPPYISENYVPEERFEEDDNEYYVEEKRGSRGLGWLLALLVLGAIVAGVLFGSKWYSARQLEQERKAIQDSLVLEFVDESPVMEYGVQYVGDLPDAFKQLIKDSNGDVRVDLSTYDPYQVGLQNVSYYVSLPDRNGDPVEIKKILTVLIQDLEAPTIVLHKGGVKIGLNQEFDPHSNILSITDPVDGDIPEGQGGEGQAYYTIDASKLNVNEVGEYDIKIQAFDSTGNMTSVSYPVLVGNAPHSNDSIYQLEAPNYGGHLEERNKYSLNAEEAALFIQHEAREENLPIPEPSAQEEEIVEEESAVEENTTEEVIEEEEVEEEQATPEPTVAPSTPTPAPTPEPDHTATQEEMAGMMNQLCSEYGMVYDSVYGGCK